jgi:PAS domain S-box-containing protein
MSKKDPSLTGVERTFGEDELIVSKTDATGRLTYVNDVFLRVGLYDEDELLGEQHSIIRHPDMPRCVFKLLWDTIQSGKEIFAYVINRAKTGDHYWVYAHVTPTFDKNGKVIGYHSNRRVARKEALAKITPLYARLVEIEKSAPDRKIGLEKSHEALVEILNDTGISYAEFVISL